MTLRGLRGAPVVSPLCQETQSLGQKMLELGCENATVGKNGLTSFLLDELVKWPHSAHILPFNPDNRIKFLNLIKKKCNYGIK